MTGYDRARALGTQEGVLNFVRRAIIRKTKGNDSIRADLKKYFSLLACCTGTIEQICVL